MRSQEASLGVFLLVLLLALTAATRGGFLQGRNIADVLVNASFPAVAAIGMTLVIAGGEIDISIGSILAVCAVLAGNLAVAGLPLWLVILAALVAGTAMGALNGMLVAYAKIPAIIVTLGALSFWRGLVITVTQGAWIYNMPESFHFAERSLLGIPVPIYIMAFAIVLGSLWMHYRPLGRQVYAVGGNRQASVLAGIPVQRILLMNLTLNGTFAALAALIYASRFSVVQSNAGIGFEFQVITAVVIGGTSIMGGTGTIWGSLIGAVLMATIATGMTFVRISPYWLQTVQGSLILLAVTVDVLRRRSRAGI
jgi:ribose/xylose/arabinose/galactoside ABC-type transport system permease subunit